jgi:two-component sensor histidine kinase
MIIDRYGYLWICTPKGVVRYNGYESRLFGLDEGLSGGDVYNLCEDSKGRVWLASLSSNIGYLQNGKYNVAKLPEKHVGTIFPDFMNPIGNSIVFGTRYTTDQGGKYKLFLGVNDSFSEYRISNFRSELGFKFLASHIGKYFIITLAAVSEIRPVQINGKDTFDVKAFFLVPDSLQHYLNHQYMVFGNYILCYDIIGRDDKAKSGNAFLAINGATGLCDEVKMRDRYGVTGNVQYIYPATPDFFYVITDRHILKFDEDCRHISTIEIKQLAPLGGAQIKTFLENDFWGSCIGTTTKGVWINYNAENKFRKKNINLENYVYKGGLKDSVFFWWSVTKRSLAIIEQDKVQYCELSELSNITNIGPYNKDSFLIQGSKLRLFLRKRRKVEQMPMYMGGGLYYAIRDSNTIYVVASSGFFKTTISSVEIDHSLDLDIYHNLKFDSVRNLFWAYDSRAVCVYNKNDNTKVKIVDSAIEQLGVTQIENIVFDNKYGNIFLKGYDNISMYNFDKKSTTNVFAKYNLKGASISIYNDLLIVAGRFGILFSKIFERDSLSEPVFYRNIKDVNYQVIHNCLPAWGKVLLNTDKGVYEVQIPSDSQMQNALLTSSLFPYKFIINLGDSSVSAKSGDTLYLDQKNTTLLLDIINPFGDGKVKYKCRFSDGTWQELNANELLIPTSCSPDNYYLVSMVASDNAWKSDEMDLYLYIEPLWWQTYSGRKLISGAIIAGVLLLFVLSVTVTRRTVIKANKRRNLQMEMELKAIYAQINPHFIFNTLNSALLLIRKKRLEEAYEHISQFSRLLRSYIRSSRNKLITIADEIKNLHDYLELQKTRFAGKFQFSILVDGQIEPERVKIPSLLLQPFVENAINHGLLPRNEEGRLQIEFRHGTNKNEIICLIDDDGIGRANAKVQEKAGDGKKDSYGDMLISDLVAAFNKYEQMNIAIKYFDKEYPHTGTTVMIYIKNPNYD